VHWNGTELNTVFVSSTQLSATVPAANIATATTASVAVVSPPQGGGTSNPIFFGVSKEISQASAAVQVETVGTGSHPVSSIISADFNADGKPDIAGVTQNSIVFVMLGRGDGSLLPPQEFSTGNNSDALIAGDFNGDGKIDLATANADDSTISVLLGNGDGTFQSQITSSVGMISSPPMAVADFNGDGSLDLAIAGNKTGNSGQVFVLLGNGDGTFQPFTTYQLPGPGIAVALAAGDFNSDGKLDLAAASNSGSEIRIMSGNGDGTFQDGILVESLNSVASGAMIAADLNGDAHLDLVMAGQLDKFSQWALVTLGDGNNGFGSLAQYFAGPDPLDAIQVADYNSDGKIDLVVGQSQYVGILTGNGDGTFPTSPQLLSVPGGYGEAVADFNGDGKLDVARGGYDSGSRILSVSLALQGSFPIASIYALPVTPVVIVGVPTIFMQVFLTNDGNATLSVGDVSISGIDAAEFTQTNTCSANVLVNGFCRIDVTFAPIAVGSRVATLTITDNAPGSPHTVALVGNAASLGLGPAPGSSTSATVTAGASASYTLQIGGEQVGGVAVITCTGAPTGATCTPPSTLSFSPDAPATFAVKVTTTSRTLAAAQSRSEFAGWTAATILIGFVLVPLNKHKRGAQYRLASMGLFFLLFLSGCNGGSNSGGVSSTNPNGTPAGSYKLTVVAQNGSDVQSQDLTLVVQ
jgi:hypothetical protein